MVLTTMPATAPLKTIPLSDAKILKAIQSVYVRPVGRIWRVKRVAAPTIWRFERRADAIAKARAIASPIAWDVVVMNRKGRVERILDPKHSRVLAKAVI